MHYSTYIDLRPQSLSICQGADALLDAAPTFPAPFENLPALPFVSYQQVQSTPHDLLILFFAYRGMLQRQRSALVLSLARRSHA